MNKNKVDYQAILNGIQDMIFVMRVSEDQQLFYYDYLNKVAMEELGLSENIIGKEIAEVNSLQVTAVLYEKYRTVIELREPITYQDDYIIKQETKKVSETTLTPQFEGEKVVRIIALTRDITAFKETEREKDLSNHRLKLSRLRYKSLFAENSDSIIYLDLQGKILRANQAFNRLMNQSDENFRGKAFLDILKPKRLSKVKQAFQQTLGGTSSVVDTEVSMSDDTEAVLQIKLTPMMLEQEIRGVYAIMKDMTAEQFAKEALMASEERFRLIAENSSDLIQLIDERGQFVYLSPSHQKVLGYDPNALFNRKLLDIVDQQDHQLIKELLETYQKANTHSIEVRFNDINDKEKWFELRAQPIFTKNKHFKHIVVVARDIEERKQHEEQLRQFAYHDYLTNLPNRRLFHDRLDQVIATHERKQHNNFAVMMLDLDDFKKINDQYGHDTGDKVIIEFGQRLKSAVREMDTVARMGGDEFMILLPEVDDARNVERVVKRIEGVIAQPWQVDSYQFSLGSSIGIIIPTCKNFDAQQIINKADEVLYQAKNTGKNKSIIEICNYLVKP